jgi:hypothetical protein
MKITEQQLASLFNSNRQHNNDEPTGAGDCLAANPASSDRLRQAEQLLNDPITAQAMQMAMATKPFAEAVARDISEKQQPWYHRLMGQPAVRWAMAGAAFAFVFLVASPDTIESNTPLHVPVLEQNVANDVINNGRFDQAGDDIMNIGGFEPTGDEADVLSKHSFG